MHSFPDFLRSSGSNPGPGEWKRGWDSFPEVWCSGPTPSHLSASQEVTHFPRSRTSWVRRGDRKGCVGYNLHPYWELRSQDSHGSTRVPEASLRGEWEKGNGAGVLSQPSWPLPGCVNCPLLFLLGIRSGNGPRGLATCWALLPFIPVLSL